MEILLFIIALLVIGSYKKDFSTLLFSGIGFILYGLMTLNSEALFYPYNFQFGILSIFFGFYISFRSGIELIAYKKEVKDNDNR